MDETQRKALLAQAAAELDARAGGPRAPLDEMKVKARIAARRAQAEVSTRARRVLAHDRPIAGVLKLEGAPEHLPSRAEPTGPGPAKPDPPVYAGFARCALRLQFEPRLLAAGPALGGSFSVRWSEDLAEASLSGPAREIQVEVREDGIRIRWDMNRAIRRSIGLAFALGAGAFVLTGLGEFLLRAQLEPALPLILAALVTTLAWWRGAEQVSRAETARAQALLASLLAPG